MPNLKEVRNRITSVQSTQQITKAMKMVAAAKLRRAQDRTIQMRPYAAKLSNLLGNVMSATDESVSSVYAEERSVERILIVVVTSDRGLCGGFNANIAKATTALIEKKYASQYQNGNLTLLCIGKKGYDYFRRRDYNIEKKYVELFSSLGFEQARKASEFIMDEFAKKSYDTVEMIYNEFKNVATQIVQTEVFLPLSDATFEQQDKTDVNGSDYIFEPDKIKIIAELLPKVLKVQFYRSLLESNAAEQGARMTAMDKATENAGELLKNLKLVYNRSRQAAITNEILEIVGGAEALAQG